MTTLERPLLLLGDCLEQLRELPDNSVDSVVTDPPYGLSFMGKKWDYDVPSVEVWAECLRVLNPGGHLLAFAGTRTQHRMAVRIEDAGFEIRDMIAWVYGSGFPKSLDVSKAIDKAAGAEREVIERRAAAVGFDAEHHGGGGWSAGEVLVTTPATDAARQWQGWGTALKPALEPITVARKPLGEKTVAANVLVHGTGGLNVDGCRVEHVTVEGGSLALNPHLRSHINGGNGGKIIAHEDDRRVVTPHASGRWPANLIHDGSEEVLAGFPETASGKPSGIRKVAGYATATENGTTLTGFGDSGSAARFFYCAKASKRDRDEGLDGFEFRPSYMVENGSKTAAASNGVRYDRTTMQRNNHPTVKPTDLMRYLCRLVTPPEGIVLDPFAGSGSTGKAAILEGFRFIGIERDEEYMKIAEARIAAAIDSKKELLI